MNMESRDDGDRDAIYTAIWILYGAIRRITY